MTKLTKLIPYLALIFVGAICANHANADDWWKIKKKDFYKVVPKLHKNDVFGDGNTTTFFDGRGFAVSGVWIANPTNFSINYAMFEKGKWVTYTLIPGTQNSHFATGNPQVHPSIRFDSDFANGAQYKSYSLPGKVEINKAAPGNELPFFEFRQIQNGLELFKAR